MTCPSTVPSLELPLIPVGSPLKTQTNGPTAFLTTNGSLKDCPTLKIKFPGYSMTRPIEVLVAVTISSVFL